MKTVTKTFYVSENDFNLLKRNQDSNIVIRMRDESRYHHIDNKAIHPITISWQEPERKIEITESDCVARLMKHNWYSKEDAEFICSRIFGAENEL